MTSETKAIEVMGHEIQYDRSGVGHCWVAAEWIDCPPSVQEEIAAEILDGRDECRDYLASNGDHYRWERAR